MRLDLTGKRFSRLMALEKVGSTRRYVGIWRCICDCGAVKDITATSLQGGFTKSCGCWKREISGKSNITHGMWNTRTWRIWKGMKSRCKGEYSGNVSYKRKNIKVCDRWLESFENFYEDMGLCPSDNHSIDRIDTQQGYTPENCRWATQQQQTLNSEVNRRIEYRGEVKCVSEWAREFGLSQAALTGRLNRGWGVDRALNQPLRKRVTNKYKK